MSTKKYVQLSENGLILGTTDETFEQENQPLIEFPDGFDFSQQGNFTITKDSKVVYATDILQAESRKAAIFEQRRPLTEQEVSRMLLAQQVNTLAVDDSTALRMKDFYPVWTAGESYAVGYKVQRNGRLFRVLQAHTSQIGWEPENAASLWTEICETHSGEQDDPISYNGNMELTEGLYYWQDDTLYRCIRSTGTPVYHALRELVGLYVEVTA